MKKATDAIVFKERTGKSGGGKGILWDVDCTYTVATFAELKICYKAESKEPDMKCVVYPGVGITEPRNGNNPQPGDPCPTLTEDSRNYLVGKIDAGG